MPDRLRLLGLSVVPMERCALDPPARRAFGTQGRSPRGVGLGASPALGPLIVFPFLHRFLPRP
jgi:hypothetical protein